MAQLYSKNTLFLIFLIKCVLSTDIIVSNHPVCTEMGIKYIKEYDVTVSELAIIVSVCEGIVNPQYSGLGGGFMAVVYDGSCKDKPISLNSREKAPAAYDSDSRRKYGEIGVPSMLKGYETLYEMKLCGKKPKLEWIDLFTENIKLAKHGWVISLNTKKLLPRIKNVDHTLNISLNEDWMNNPTLSKTLERIANEGPLSSLYQENGYLFNQVLNDLQTANSFISSNDLLQYTADTSETFEHRCLNYTIATSRIPGSGSTLILGCKIINEALSDLNGFSDEQKFLFMYHTLRHMYSVKPYLRSKFFNLTTFLENSDIIAREIVELVKRKLKWDLEPFRKFGNYIINDDRVRFKREFGTTNIVLRRGKSAITMTSTVNWYFGSRLCSKDLGIFYNNQLKDFDYKNTPNGPKGGKTPQSSTTATILYSEKGNPVFQIGAAGGSKMIGVVFNTFFNYFIRKMDLKSANEMGRCTPQYLNQQETILCEKNVEEKVKKMFKDIGMNVTYTDELLGGVTASSTVHNKPEAVFDIRRGGSSFPGEEDRRERSGDISGASRNN